MEPALPCTAAFVWATGAPRSSEALFEMLREVFADSAEQPARMLLGTRSRKMTAYNEARLAKAMSSPDTMSVLVQSKTDPPVVVGLHLNDGDPRHAPYLHRYAKVVLPPTTTSDPRIARFFDATCTLYPVNQGGVIQAATEELASAECSTMGSDGVRGELWKRLGFDSMHRREALQHLRRLYPVTIIGPEIWATLPPLPAVDPPLVVRDLANCKMITAWPTLVDSHDLQFLLGTRELRRWLWPYTIQNPADDPDEIDRRLKWAELLPW